MVAIVLSEPQSFSGYINYSLGWTIFKPLKQSRGLRTHHQSTNKFNFFSKIRDEFGKNKAFLGKILGFQCFSGKHLGVQGLFQVKFGIIMKFGINRDDFDKYPDFREKSRNSGSLRTMQTRLFQVQMPLYYGISWHLFNKSSSA